MKTVIFKFYLFVTILIVVLLTGCAASVNSNSASSNTSGVSNVILPNENQDKICGNTESYKSIIKESAQFADEVSSRLAGRLVECEFNELSVVDKIALGEEVEHHLEFLMQNKDTDVYEESCELLHDWIGQTLSKMENLTLKKRLGYILSNMLLIESAIIKREINFVTKCTSEQLLSAQDRFSFYKKYNKKTSLLNNRFESLQLQGNPIEWINTEVKNRINDMKLDVKYLKTGDFCRKVSMDLFILVEDKSTDNCNIEPAQY